VYAPGGWGEVTWKGIRESVRKEEAIMRESAKGVRQKPIIEGRCNLYEMGRRVALSTHGLGERNRERVSTTAKDLRLIGGEILLQFNEDLP